MGPQIPEGQPTAMLVGLTSVNYGPLLLCQVELWGGAGQRRVVLNGFPESSLWFCKFTSGVDFNLLFPSGS